MDPRERSTSRRVLGDGTILVRGAPDPQPPRYLFSPVWGKLDARWLAEQIIADQLPVRFQLQLHKLVWDPNQRGV